MVARSPARQTLDKQVVGLIESIAGRYTAKRLLNTQISAQYPVEITIGMKGSSGE